MEETCPIVPEEGCDFSRECFSSTIGWTIDDFWYKHDFNEEGCLNYCEVQWMYDCAVSVQPWDQEANIDEIFCSVDGTVNND